MNLTHSCDPKFLILLTGILIGIGETRAERLVALLELRRLQLRHGHIQELIIQNFRAKKGTAMALAAEPSLDELCWSIAAARIMFGSAISIQVCGQCTGVW